MNFSALEQYAAEYSGLLADRLFEQKPTLTGRDILEKIPVKQIGLFTLFQLFEKWKSETEQLKSPYFDYESNEVQTKMKELMNALSKTYPYQGSTFCLCLPKPQKILYCLFCLL